MRQVLLLCLAVSVWARPPAPVPDGFARAAKTLGAALNQSVDPCSNFYEFACGGWIAAHPIPDDLTSYSHFTELRQKVQAEMRVLFESKEESTSKAINKLKTIYKACMDTEGLNERKSNELLHSLKILGLFPAVHVDQWDRKNFDLTGLLIDVAQTRGVDVFFDVYVSTDFKNASQRLLAFDQGSLGLGSGARNYYLNQTKYAKQITAYKKYMAAKIALLTGDAGLPVVLSKIESDVAEMFELETRLANIMTAEEDRRNYTELYNPRPLSELKKLMPVIDWDRYFRAVTPFAIHDYLSNEPTVVIHEMDFMGKLCELFRESDPKVITNYIVYRYTSSWSMQLDVRYEDIYQEFVFNLLGKKSKSPRWKDCTSATTDKMVYASGALYVRNHFNKDSKASTMEMIKDLKASFGTLLVGNDWMDEHTKKEGGSNEKNTLAVALDKALEGLELIGYPDFILDDEKLDAWYAELDIVAGSTYAEVVEATSRWGINFNYKRLLEPVDRKEFSSNAATVNAFYSSIKNGIIFPAAILQVPFFDHFYPKSLNYGGIGAVIGHEITHGFDDTGSQFDAHGNLREWWDNNTRRAFTEKTKCFIEQYGSIEVPGTGLNLNGELTVGENIADNGGVKQAFKAYKSFIEKNGREPALPGLEKFTNEQLFFMGYAQSWCGNYRPETLIRLILTDPHAPGIYRVNVVLSNQPEFAEAFSCPANSAMNPEKRCVLW